jgi:hypothetical protein
MTPASPPFPLIYMSIGVSGHRATHPEFAENSAAIERALAEILERIGALQSQTAAELSVPMAPPQINTLLVDGTDQIAAFLALERGWKLCTALPFGRMLNRAINARPLNLADAKALLAGEAPRDSQTQSRADAIIALADQANILELADKDDVIIPLYLAAIRSKADAQASQKFIMECAQRAAIAGRILIEQSDFLIAVWDGVSTSNIGGSGHTVAFALDQGAPVIWIDPKAPEDWRILHAPESLAVLDAPHDQGARDLEFAAIVTSILRVDGGSEANKREYRHGIDAMACARWHEQSNRVFHAFRWIESRFGGSDPRQRSLVQTYETPAACMSGSGKELLAAIRAMPEGDASLGEKIGAIALKNFAWADGISARLSDLYRGGMTLNFILSALAIIGEILYLPLAGTEYKWGFALFELFALLAIVGITFVGQKYRWHGRWFETRRAAEYLRHSPMMLILGATRAPNRWPRGTETS